MESAVRKEQEDRELLLELEKLAPDMQQQLVYLVRTVAASTNADSGPVISAAGFELLAALHGAARPQAVTSEGSQCAPHAVHPHPLPPCCVPSTAFSYTSFDCICALRDCCVRATGWPASRLRQLWSMSLTSHVLLQIRRRRPAAPLRGPFAELAALVHAAAQRPELLHC